MTFDDIMNYHPDNKNVYGEIKRNLSKLVPFVGAGLTKFSYYTWSDALKKLSENITDVNNNIELNVLIQDKEYFEVAQKLEKLRGKENLARDIANLFSSNHIKEDLLDNEAISLLPKLFPQFAVTTNFDQILERVYNSGKNGEVVMNPNQSDLITQYLMQNNIEPGILKLHGTVNGEFIEYDNIVFTREQYERFYGKRSKLNESLKKLFTNKSILFLGCSLTKDYTMNLLDQVVQEGSPYYTIINCNRAERDDKIRDLSDNHHIRAILYEGNHHEAVKIILENLLSEKNGNGNWQGRREFLSTPETFKQYIIDESNVINDEIDFIPNNKHLIIYGAGGLGKSTYLYELSKRAINSERFSFVLHASLPAIENFGKDNKPNTFDDVTRFEKPENSFIFNYLFSQKEFNRSVYQAMISSCKSRDVKPVLLLLDDLNQLRDAMSGISDAIINEIECLSRNREYSNLVIVITNRSSKSCFSRSLYKTITITGTPDNECEKIIQKFDDNECIRRLVKVPMYYKMLETIPNNTVLNTKYDVLNAAYCELSSKPTAFSSSSTRAVLYYVIAPKIARYIAEGRCVTKSRESIISEIARVIKMFQEDLRYYHLVLSEFYFEEDINMDYELKSMQANVVYEHMRNCNIIEISDDMVGFIHQDWRDYLAAKSLLCDYQILLNKAKDNHADVFGNIRFDLNIPDSVNDLFLEGLGITGDIQSQNEKLRLILNVDVCDDNGLAPSFFSIQFMDALCQISETLGSTCTEEQTKKVLHEKLFKAFYCCIEAKDAQYIQELLAAGCKDYMISILAKESEYFRRNTMYQDALKCIRFGMELNAGDEELKLRNQEGKIYLHYFQSVKSKIKVLQPLQLTPKKSFEKGFGIIKECAGKCSNMSSNLYGMMISTPAPYLKGIVNIDYVEAFWTYYNVLNSKEQVFYGKQLAYSIRQAVSLIIKGYVIVNFDGVMNLNTLRYGGRNLIHGAGPIRLSKSISKGGCSLAESLLALISGDTLYFTNYLRGCVELYKGNNGDAKRYFLQDNSLLSKIRLKYEFGVDVDLKAELKKVYDNWHSEKQRYGEMDKFHPYYVYEDAKSLILEYEPNSKLFDEIEKGC